MNAVQLMSNGIQQQPQHHATVVVPLVDVEDLEPQPRDRCNTWPLQKPTGDLSHNTSPLIHEVLPEEEDGLDEDEEDDDSSLEAASDASVTNGFGGYSPTTGMNRGGQTVAANQQHHHCSMSAAAANSKKNSSRRNAWGNLSYADLITQAILSSPDNRLTLSQIYDWMVHNVPYFRDKGDSNSSAGWKNSIRHNLSLHSRFMRVQNEGAGKSSWWMINPDAKHGKCSRRRTGSMEQSSKLWEKKRGRLKKSANGDEVAYSAVSMETLPLSDDLDNNGGGANMDFRCRVGSAYSSSVTSRHGGSDPQLLDDAWADGNGIVDGQVSSNDAADSHSPYTALVETLPQSMTLLETKTSSSNNDLQVQQQHSPYRAPKLEYSPGHAYTNGHCQQPQQHHVQIKQEPLDNGPLLSDVFERLYYASPPQQQAPVTNYHQQQRVMLSPYRNSSVDDHHGQQMRRLNYYYYHAPSTAAFVVNNDQLPSELSELHYDSYFKSDVQWDIDQVIRHELTLTGKLDFNDLANV